MSEIKAKIISILIDTLALEESDLGEDQKFYEDLGVDSLDFFEVIVSIEKSLRVTIPDDEVTRLRTVGALAAYVEKNSPHRSLMQVA